MRTAEIITSAAAVFAAVSFNNMALGLAFTASVGLVAGVIFARG